MSCRELSRKPRTASEHCRSSQFRPQAHQIGLRHRSSLFSHRSWPSFSHGVSRGDVDWHLHVPSVFNIQNAFKTLQPVVQMFRRHACTADGQAHELQHMWQLAHEKLETCECATCCTTARSRSIVGQAVSSCWTVSELFATNTKRAGLSPSFNTAQGMRDDRFHPRQHSVYAVFGVKGDQLSCTLLALKENRRANYTSWTYR